jgi:hypothetical protein
VKKTSRKIKYAIAFLSVCLLAFIGFSKAGILFSENGGNIITVSTTKKTFDPNNYVASAVAINKKIAASTTTTTTTATTTTKATTTVATTTTTRTTWTGEVLSRNNGVVFGPSGKETYYNLDMSGIVSSMRNIGYSENDYPYWVRSDGVKMLGQYVMIAADFNTRPRGTIIESSLGFAIVCDTGGFASSNPTQIDIAVTW